MEHNNELSELMSRSEPVRTFHNKEKHTPHKAMKSLKNRSIVVLPLQREQNPDDTA